MGDKTDRLVPRQRTTDLVVRSRGDGTLILDRRTNAAHYLPVEVTRVWGACTGSATLAEIASAATIDEQIAAGAVDQLIALDLLEVPAGIDRRKFLQRSAVIGGGALAFAAIETVSAAPAWAQGGTGEEIEVNPGFTPVCSPDMNTGNVPNTTINFQIRMVNFPQTGVYSIVLSGPGVFFRQGGGAITATTTVLINNTGTPPAGNSSTISMGGADTHPGNPYNAAPLPATIMLTAEVTAPDGTVVGTFEFTVDNPCCSHAGGCIEPG